MEVLDLLSDLVRINSVNPNYADGTPELACANSSKTISGGGGSRSGGKRFCPNGLISWHECRADRLADR